MGHLQMFVGKPDQNYTFFRTNMSKNGSKIEECSFIVQFVDRFHSSATLLSEINPAASLFCYRLFFLKY